MLAKSSNTQLGKHKILTIFFLSLVLISLSPIATINCRGSSNQTTPAGFIVGLGPFEQGTVVPVSFPLSANSIIFVEEMGYLYGVIVGFDWNPSGGKWILKNPSNEAVYIVDVDVDYKQIAGLPDLPDWAIFFPVTWSWFFSPKAYVFRAAVPDMKVPWFPTQGTWKAELYLYDMKFGFLEESIMMVSYRISVTESTWLDNIMAPIYWSWGGTWGIGGFSVALPSIFWMTSPAWILGIFFIGLAFYARSFRLAVGLIKESGKRFKEAIKKKV